MAIVAATIAPISCGDDRPVYTPYKKTPAQLEGSTALSQQPRYIINNNNICLCNTVTPVPKVAVGLPDDTTQVLESAERS